MENTALLLIGISILLLIIIIVLVAILFYTMLRDKKLMAGQNTTSQAKPLVEGKPEPLYHPEIMDRMQNMKFVAAAKSDLMCPNHKEEAGEVTCAICDRLFCKACIKPYKTFHLCKEHLPLMMKYEWVEVLTLKTSTEDPERGVRLYDLKKEMFEENKNATYIETHYKINVENDFIETYLVLFAIKEELPLIESFIKDKL